MRNKSLTDVLPNMRGMGYGGYASYDRLHRGVVAGLIPATRTAARRWEIDPADYPIVAEVLGLKLEAPVVSVA